MTDEPSKNAEAKIAQAIESGEVVSPEIDEGIMNDCPVQPLGMCGGVYYFTSPDGELRELKARDFTDRELVSLFAGDISWMAQHFPEISRGRPTGDFVAWEVTKVLMRACHMKGAFDKETPVRGHGVWRHGEKVVVHAGDGVYFDNGWMPPGVVLGNAIYTARSRVDRPDFDHPLSDLETQELERWLNVWSFRDKGDDKLLFGFIGAAMLGGFPRWRAHAFIVGERGVGKSELNDFIADLLGAQAVSMNNYSEAGLQQKLQNEARAILLDEGEGGGDQQARRMAGVVRLLRLLSSGEGARIVRGSSGGVAQSRTVTGCVMITAINPPHLEPQDRSRIIEINLNKPAQTESTIQDLAFFRKEARRRSRGLRARAVLRASQFADTFNVFRPELVSFGCDGRQADLFSTLLAGRSILVDNEIPSPEKARELIAIYADRLKMIFQEDKESSDGQNCLNHLYDFIMDNYRSDKRLTIGQQLSACVAGDGYDDVLQSYGLKMGRDEVGKPRLFVPNDHGQLRRVFSNSAWSAGGWHKSLLRIDGGAAVKRAENPVRVAGSKRRGVWVPLEYLPRSGRTEDEYTHPKTPPPTPPRGQSKSGETDEIAF